jgi:oxaloacetate decarboxylase beta subunit
MACWVRRAVGIFTLILGTAFTQSGRVDQRVGAIDGPTLHLVATKLSPELLGPIAVAAYSYISLIPIIQPPLMKLLTTKKERMILMEYTPKPISLKTLNFFPILLTLVVGLLVPEATPLIAMLMLGNLLKVSGRTA